jgi:16S rRNA (adenine1518-N6/adenine1519-N6)-dimethyltransferase
MQLTGDGLTPTLTGRRIVTGDMEDRPKHSLGQHWLYDDASLEAMVQAAHVTRGDTVLEIGPGPGTLTAKLVDVAQQVVAVEVDEGLANSLPSRIASDNLQILCEDILKFDLGRMPQNYKVVANLPYYLTSHILRLLCESKTPFSEAALLVQKEVAERVCAKPGNCSLLSISVQFYTEASLGRVVPAELFTPPPRVDSRILALRYLKEPRYPDVDTKLFFQIVKAGFSQRRKTVLNSLSAGLQLDRKTTTEILEGVGVHPGIRAQALNLDQWYGLYKAVKARRP